MRKILFISIFATIFIYSCKCPSYPVKETIIKKDSVVYSLHDSIISIPPDTSYFEALIKCDSANKASLQTINVLSSKGVKTVVIYKDNVIKVKTTVNEDSLRIAIIDKFHLVSDTERKVIEKTIIKNEISFWQWVKFVFFLIVAFVLGMILKKPVMYLWKALVNKF